MSAIPEATTLSESFRGADGRIRQGWRTSLGSLVGLSFSPSVLQVMSLGVFAPYLHEDLGWSLRQISVAAMILAIMVTILSPLQGLLVDRFGARRMILISMPLFGLGYASLSLVSSEIWQFYVGWGAVAALAVGLWPASYVKATAGWFDKRLGVAIAVATVGIGIGAAVFPLPVDLLARTLGWRNAFALIGLGAVAIAWPVVFLFVRDRGPQSALRHDRVIEQPDGPHRRSTFWMLIAAFLLLGVYSTSILFHLVSILIDNGMDRHDAVVAQAALGAMMIAGRLGSGVLVDRMSVRLVMVVFIAAAVVALLMLASGMIGIAAIVAAALVGILIGAEIDVLGFVVKRYFGVPRYGLYYGLLYSAFQLGGAAGVVAVGAMRDSSGHYVGGLAILMASCIGAGLLFALLGPYRYGREPSVAAIGAGRAEPAE